MKGNLRVGSPWQEPEKISLMTLVHAPGKTLLLAMTQISRPVTVTLYWLWAGAAIMFGAITAPTLFNPSVLDNRELSGALAGAILKRFFTASNYLFGACVLISLLGWLSDMKARKRMEFLFFLSIALLAVNVVQDQFIRTEMVRLKLEIRNPPDDQKLGELRAKFDEWHKTSMWLYGGSVIAALAGAGWVTLTGGKTAGKGGKRNSS